MSEIIAERVTFDRHRWYVRIIIDGPDGPAEYVASADSAMTCSDGIWFGTRAEYDEEWADL